MRRREFLRTAATAGVASAALGPQPASGGTQKSLSLVAADADTQRRRRFPDVALITHEGRRVHLYRDLLEGKTVLIHFMYTRCTASCPRTTANLARVRDLLGARVGRDVFLYSVSVDPVHDSSRRLREYAKRFGVTPGWVFLTGRRRDVEALRTCFGDDPAQTSGESNHLNLFAYGVEPLQRWGACPALLDPKWVVRYLAWLDPKGERPTGWWPAGHSVVSEQEGNL